MMTLQELIQESRSSDNNDELIELFLQEKGKPPKKRGKQGGTGINPLMSKLRSLQDQVANLSGSIENAKELGYQARQIAQEMLEISMKLSGVKDSLEAALEA